MSPEVPREGGCTQYAAKEAGRPGFRSRVPSPHLPASPLLVATLLPGPSCLFPHCILRLLPEREDVLKRRRSRLRFKIIQWPIERAAAEVSKPIRNCEGQAPIAGALAPSGQRSKRGFGGPGRRREGSGKFWKLSRDLQEGQGAHPESQSGRASGQRWL